MGGEFSRIPRHPSCPEKLVGNASLTSHSAGRLERSSSAHSLTPPECEPTSSNSSHPRTPLNEVVFLTPASKPQHGMARIALDASEPKCKVWGFNSASPLPCQMADPLEAEEVAQHLTAPPPPSNFSFSSDVSCIPSVGLSHCSACSVHRSSGYSLDDEIEAFQATQGPDFSVHTPLDVLVHILRFCHQVDLMQVELTSRTLAYCIHRDKFLHAYLKGKPVSIRMRPHTCYPTYQGIHLFADVLWCAYGVGDLVGMSMDGTTRTIFEAHTAGITCFVVCDDKYLCSGSEDGTIKLWHMDELLANPFPVEGSWSNDRKEQKHCSTTVNPSIDPNYLSSPVECLQTIGKDLVSGDSYGVIRRWRVHDRHTPLEMVQEIKDVHKDALTCMVVSSNHVFTSSIDGTAIRWSKSLTPEGILKTGSSERGDQATWGNFIKSMVLSGDEVIAGTCSGAIIKYDFEWTMLSSKQLPGDIKTLVMHNGLLYAGIDHDLGIIQLDMYLNVVAYFRSGQCVDTLAFCKDTLYSGKDGGPVMKWITIPQQIWPSRQPDKRSVVREPSFSFLLG